MHKPLCLLLVLTGLTLRPAVADPADAAPTLLTQLNDPLIRQVFIDREAPKNSVGPEGAMGADLLYERNHGIDPETKKPMRWFVEEQKEAADLVIAGILRKEPALVEKGLRAEDYAFAHQDPKTGGFPASADGFHSTSFLVESTARMLTVMNLADAAKYRPEVEKYTPELHAAARWLLDPAISVPGRKHNEPFTHRRYLLAAGLGMTAALTGDEAMAHVAEEYAREGLSLQTPEGVNPERGGFDAGYHPFSIVLAARYYTVCQDPELRARLRTMMAKALHAEEKRVKETGEIDTSDSTRIGHEKNRVGKVKGPGYPNYIQGLVWGDLLLHDPSYRDEARKMATFKGWLP